MKFVHPAKPIVVEKFRPEILAPLRRNAILLKEIQRKVGHMRDCM